MTRVAFGLGGNLPVRQAVEYARYAEAQGFESCWVHEAYWNRDALSYLTAMAAGTRRLGLATGCINPYTRHPVLVASSLATLDELSGGRAVLGFGTGYPGRLDEQGIAHDRPIAAMREGIALIRRLWQGEKVTSAGRSFSLRNAALSVRPAHPVPVYLAGWGPAMLRIAGQLCDGYVARALESPASCRRLIGAVRAAASAAGRAPGAVDAAAYVLCAVSEDRAAARAAMRRDPFVIYQFAVIDEGVLRESGVDPQVKQSIGEPFWRGDLEAASREVSDALLDEFALAGTADDVIARLGAYAEAGVQLPILQPVTTAEPEVRRVIDAGREFAHSGAAAR
ncbi:MAG: LLM class flavin-dependent oxidoreductase [Bacillati bacterium ANGP1]|uniref:LLM class flavin-dependent oxidoreductase n=1 Tax=Candidatus Segetimicrobium genomatis TaxID=2569760 RepID=A0A537JMF6_9BACT|nr:MAG: LLM class flavin-dependent oxidoreductase [Terrabacteria group bacterium ANGP1]